LIKIVDYSINDTTLANKIWSGMPKYLLNNRYLPIQQFPDFWEKEENFDIPNHPEGSFDFYRFNTTVYIDPEYQKKFNAQKNAIRNSLNLTTETLTTKLQRFDIKKIEKFSDKTPEWGFEISVELCCGEEIYNYLRDKKKYKERWVFEAHIRFEKPPTDIKKNPCRPDSLQKYQDINSWRKMKEELQNRLNLFTQSLQEEKIQYLKQISSNSYKGYIQKRGKEGEPRKSDTSISSQNTQFTLHQYNATNQRKLEEPKKSAPTYEWQKVSSRKNRNKL